MSDDFDPCEYFWNNELLVQRLLYILRQTQNFCSDTECFSFSRLPGPPPVESSSNFFLTCLFFAFMVVMYITRPRSLRRPQLESNVTKNRDNISGSNDDLPPPPPAGN